jgi:hypothetical protein
VNLVHANTVHQPCDGSLQLVDHWRRTDVRANRRACQEGSVFMLCIARQMRRQVHRSLPESPLRKPHWVNVKWQIPAVAFRRQRIKGRGRES